MLGPLIALAIPRILISAGVVALVLHLVLGLPLSLAFVVGAINANQTARYRVR